MFVPSKQQWQAASPPPPATTSPQTKLANTQQKGQEAAATGWGHMGKQPQADGSGFASCRDGAQPLSSGRVWFLPTGTQAARMEHSLDRWFLMKKSFSRSLKVFSFT